MRLQCPIPPVFTKTYLTYIRISSGAWFKGVNRLFKIDDKC